MGYLEELESFFDHVQNNSARSLSRNKLIEKFFQYMSQEYGYNEDYFREQFDEKSADYNDFDEFIYKYYMGLTRDLRREYEKVETEAKERIKLYKKNVSELHNKVESISLSEKYTREKYIFFLSINKKLLQKAEEVRKKEEIFRRALRNCRENSNWFWGNWFCDNTFSDIQQYDYIDWKSKINFLEANIREGDEFTKIKRSDREEYLTLFKSYIDEHNILERILYSVLNNYYLQNRKEIIKEAVNLFVNENYIPFVYLLVPQIEGLFDVYKNVLGINNDEKANGLIEKLEQINEYKRLWGYVYYAFEFPVLRNDIAHGNMVEITSEIAYDTLMDIFYLFQEIDSSQRQYKVMLNFFETFSSKAMDSASIYVLEYFSCSIEGKDNLGWLEKCLDGRYESLLQWYGHLNTFNKLKEFFGSSNFRSLMHPNEELEIISSIEMDGKQYSCKSINDKLKKYMPLLDILIIYMQFPPEWIADVKQQICEIDKKIDEKHQLLNRLIPLSDAELNEIDGI